MKRRRLAALLGALALTLSATSAVCSRPISMSTFVTGPTLRRTPYIQESPAIDSEGLLQGGHNDHLGPGLVPGREGRSCRLGRHHPAVRLRRLPLPRSELDRRGQEIWNNDCKTLEHAPAIHVEKTASDTSLGVGGGSVTYTYVVTNTGNVPLTDVSVSDDKCSPGRICEWRHGRR